MSKSNLVLVVDDDKQIAQLLEGQLKARGFGAQAVHDGASALVALEKHPIALVLSDLKMPGMSGLELLREVRRRGLDTPFVMISAHGNVATAIEAIREGAADFLEKPWDIDELAHVVRKELAIDRSRSTGTQDQQKQSMLGGSQAMIETRRRLDQAARYDSLVLLLGEPGTGKELAARAIHDNSERRGKPFVIVDCAVFSEQLLAAELYGTTRGAFTGATDKPGRVEVAEGGTLFLDEIGELSPDAQKSLLRLLQEKTYSRVGSTEMRRANVRFVVATNRPLARMAGDGAFRVDLLTRLDGVNIALPLLRERQEDIAVLARHFMRQHGERMRRPGASLTDGAVAVLASQKWERGNVRQLNKFLESVLVFSDEDTLDAPAIERELVRGGLSSGALPPAGPGGAPPPLAVTMAAAERAAVVAALGYANGKREVATLVLGISKRSLQYKIAEYGL